MSHRPKVMHVVESFGGGVIQSIAKICHATAAICDIVIVFSKRPQTPDNYRDLYPENVTFTEWNATRSIHPVKDFKSLLALKKIVHQHQPDVMHLHSSKAGALGRLAFPCSNNMRILYSPRAYGFLQQNLSKPKKQIYYLLEKILGKTCHTTVACGEAEYQLAKRFAKQTILIKNAVDISYLEKHSKQNNKYKKITIASSGRISEQKNFPLFVEVAKQFLKTDIRFLWVGGDAPSDIELPENVTVTGWVNQDEAINYISQSHIYIQTSLWEGLSLTVLEAMGMGLPVVISDAVGNAEMVNEGEDGYVCASVEDYVKHIKALSADKAHREALSKNAKAKIEAEYSYKKSKKLWQDLYRGV